MEEQIVEIIRTVVKLEKQRGGKDRPNRWARKFHLTNKGWFSERNVSEEFHGTQEVDCEWYPVSDKHAEELGLNEFVY